MTRMTRPDCAVMCNLINTHTHIHISLIPPWEDQREWHRMTRMTRPDCAVMCNLINTHTHTHTLPPWEDQCEWHRMTRMTGPDCAVMCNLINTHTHTLDITIVNPCAGSNLGDAARHVGKRLADAVERKKNKYRGSFPATYSLLPLAMSTCGDVGSDVHVLIKELAIRRAQHRSETYSNESQHLAEGTEVARLRRRFCFVLQQALPFRTRHHLCRQGVALASTRQPHSQGSASVQAPRTGG